MQVELTGSQVHALMAQMPADARAPGSGVIYDGAALTIPDAFAAAAQTIMATTGWDGPGDILRAYAATVRWLKETGGIVVGGVEIATDESSQAKITGAQAMVGLKPSFATAWKGSDGSFTVLSAQQITAVAQAVGAHVAACFAAEAQVDAAIMAGTIKTFAEVDAALAAVTGSTGATGPTGSTGATGATGSA